MNKRAVTAKEKKEIIKRLSALWIKNPYFRLSQLIENVYPHDGDCMYYIEDYRFMDELEKFYE